MNLPAVLGVAGVSPFENDKALKVGSFLNLIVMAAIALMLVDLILFFTEHPIYVPELHILVWGLFFAELVINLLMVDDRRRYIQQNWLNVLILIIAFPWVSGVDSELAMFIRSLRLLLLIRFFTGLFRTTSKVLSKNRFGQILLGFAFLILGAGTLFSYIEERPLLDGLWYALVTITTVGYGDVVPSTEAGRAFGGVLIIFGVLFFSLVTANIAAFLVGSGQRKVEHDILKTVHNIEKHIVAQTQKTELETQQLIEELNRQIEELQQEVEELRKTEQEGAKKPPHSDILP